MFVKIAVEGAEHVYECDAYHVRNINGQEETYPVEEIQITMERHGKPDIHWQSVKDGVSVFVTNNDGKTIDRWVWENNEQTAKVSI